jgi:hypothetical protein
MPANLSTRVKKRSWRSYQVGQDPLPRNSTVALSALIFPFSDAASLISSLESRLANSLSADAVGLLKQEHAEELQGMRAAQELETDLTKTREAESSLRLEFDRQLAKEQQILSMKYNCEVDELRASLESKVESRDAKISELETLRALDSKQHDDDLSAWRTWDRKLHSGLQGLEDALRGMLLPSLPSLCSFKPFPHFLAALVGAFPDSDEAATAVLEKYRAEQKIVPCCDLEAKFTSRELMALVKGRLHPVAKLGVQGSPSCCLHVQRFVAWASSAR